MQLKMQGLLLGRFEHRYFQSLRAAVLLFLLALFPCTVIADEPVRIGVLAFREKPLTLRQWEPTADQLHKAVEGRRFEMVPLYFGELDRAVATAAVDFVLTNPEHYVQLSTRHHLAAISTLVSLAEGEPTNRFGGVILARSARKDINTLADIGGKSIASPGEQSLGGYMAQAWALHQANVHLPHDAGKVIFMGMPHDRTVQAVLAGTADVGFVRTGIIESMVREGKLDVSQLKVINAQAPGEFPQAISTDLFPEWPFSVMPHVDTELARKVAIALLNIRPGDSAAKAGGYHGFSPPGDYRAIDDLRLKLRAHPDQLEYFGFSEILKKYSSWLIALTVGLFVGALIFLLILAHKNQQLTKALALADKLSLRDALLDSLGEGVYGINTQGLCTFINPAALRMLGLEQAEIIGLDQHRVFHHHRPDGTIYPAEECPIHLTIADGKRRQTDEWFFRKDGSMLAVKLYVTPLMDGQEVSGAVVAFQDISEQRQLEEKILNLALHDALTGLPNRRLLDERMTQALAKARRHATLVALLFLDLDGFKTINDTHGHETGDGVLLEVSRRLLGRARATDTVSRLAGDEFVMIIEDVKSPADLESVAANLTEVLAKPIHVGALTCQITVSIGIALYPDHGNSLETLLHRADGAMYEAKRAGKNTWRHATPA